MNANDQKLNDMLELPSYSSDVLQAFDISQLIDRLRADEYRAPRALIDECARRGDDIVESLRALVEGAAYWREDSDDRQFWIVLDAALILGLIGTERAGLLLVAVLAQMSREDNDVLLDWIADGWPALFRNKPVAVEPALRTLCMNRQLSWYGRVNGIDAVLTWAYSRGETELCEALDWLAKIVNDKSENWDVRTHSAVMMLDVPRPQHRALLERFVAATPKHKRDFELSTVKRAYAQMIDRPHAARRPDPWQFYAPEEIAGRCYGVGASDDRLDFDRLSDDVVGVDLGVNDFYAAPPFAAETYFGPIPRIGRNDPCPCGSGKKYKKCCLAI